MTTNCAGPGAASAGKSKPHWPRAVRERARLLYVSGRTSSLRELAETTGIPHDTLRRWCYRDAWNVLAEEADAKAAQDLGNWLAEQREEHMKRTLARAEAIHRQIDRALATSSPLPPKTLCALVQAMNRLDVSVNRLLMAAG